MELAYLDTAFRESESVTLHELAKVRGCGCKSFRPLRVVREAVIRHSIGGQLVRVYACECGREVTPFTETTPELAAAAERVIAKQALPRRGMLDPGKNDCPECGSTNVMVGAFILSCCACGWSHNNVHACRVCGEPAVSSAGSSIPAEGIHIKLYGCRAHGKLHDEMLKRIEAARWVAKKGKS